jgi:hypothetical protein
MIGRGTRFGRLTVTSDPKNGNAHCRCTCGESRTVAVSDLSSRKVTTCGKCIGRPGTRSDGEPYPFQIHVAGKPFAGYESRRAAEADVSIFAASPAMKGWAFSIVETSTSKGARHASQG